MAIATKSNSRKPAAAYAIVGAVVLLALLFLNTCSSPPTTLTPKPTTSPEKQTAAAPPEFLDITDAAGLNFKQSHGGCGLHYFVEQVAAGAAILDADGDGNLDICFAGPKPLGACVGKVKGDFGQRLYLGDGKGHFRLSRDAFHGVKTEYGIGVAVGDYDNDGHPDLYLSCYGKNKLFHNDGHGTFTDVTDRAGLAVGGFCTNGVWFDYDGDGKLDLYVMRYCEWSIATDQTCEGPNGQRDSCNPHNYVAATNKLFHNDGNGKFTDVTAKSGASPDRRRSLSAAAVDVDQDGKLDLFVANDLGPNFLLHNNGNGTFTDMAVQQSVAFGVNGNGQANMGIATGDYDLSGRMSFFITTFFNEPKTLYHNDGVTFSDASESSGTAAASKSFLAFGTCFVDTRNAGLLDLFLANGHISSYSYLNDPLQTYKQRNQLLLNDGNGKFAEAKDALPKSDVRVHRSALLGDFDNDGRMDILTTASDDRPTLLHNQTAAGSWLMLKLVNKYGCATPIGTSCIVTVNGKKLLRSVISGGSYGGDSDFRVHFGLGSASKVDQLEIKWLSGKTDVYTNVPVNQILSYTEKAN